VEAQTAVAQTNSGRRGVVAKLLCQLLHRPALRLLNKNTRRPRLLGRDSELDHSRSGSGRFLVMEIGPERVHYI
jgi:hypothetical protein